MEIITNIILPIVYIVAGIALVWFLIELAITLRSARSTVAEVNTSLQPTLKNVQQITDDVQPIIKKVDPLVESVSLTVDAANLEIMRIDGILEDVGSIANTATKAVDAVDNVTSAPLNLVNSMTDKLRSKFGPKHASDESVCMGQVRDAMLREIDETTEPSSKPSAKETSKASSDKTSSYVSIDESASAEKPQVHFEEDEEA